MRAQCSVLSAVNCVTSRRAVAAVAVVAGAAFATVVRVQAIGRPTVARCNVAAPSQPPLLAETGTLSFSLRQAHGVAHFSSATFALALTEGQVGQSWHPHVAHQQSSVSQLHMDSAREGVEGTDRCWWHGTRGG
eukprot:SAG31_NODE_4091_length_3600_cov_4.531848_2_plen_134_part_00